MKKIIQSMTGGYSSSACVVDGTLILSLPDAITPSVWRMDLGHAKSSALEVRENVDKTFALVLKTPRGDVNDIAPFANKALAVKALMAVSRALEQSQGQTRAVQTMASNDMSVSVAGVKKGKGKLLTSIVAIILLVGLIALFVRLGPSTVPMGAGSEQTATFESGEARPGVSMSADDFLRSR